MTKKDFKKEVNNIVNVAITNANKFLKVLEVTISIDWDYDSFGTIHDGHAIGVYEHDSIFEGEIRIGFNISNLYKTFKDITNSYPFTSEITILNEMIFTNVYHEMGHGIINLIDDYLQNTDELDELYDNNQQLFDWCLDNEEDCVEQFAWDFYDNQLENNNLYKLLKLYLSLYNNNINESIENIPVDCGEFSNVYKGQIKYNQFEYFGNCVNAVKVFGDATTMSNFINSCSIIDVTEVIYKLRNGDRKLPSPLINNINRLLKTNNIKNHGEIVAGINDYQKIMFIYLTKTDKHYFFDCC